MTREKYESLPLATLRELARVRRMKGVSTMKKGELIDAMLLQDEKEQGTETKTEETSRSAVATATTSTATEKAEESREKRETTDMEELDSGEVADGILEVMPDGYGFIRCENYMPGDQDVYVSPSQIRRFNLKTGDIVRGNKRIKTQSEKFSALLYVSTINGYTTAEAALRKNFEDLTPIFPNERLRLEGSQTGTAMRVVDLLSPIGKGQRGMIVSPPKAGKTTLLKEVALSLQKAEPSMHLLILLIDERPEEVTDIREAIAGPNVEVIYSTFDELPEHHKRVSEMVIERAKRLVEHGKDVTILLDSITRLARAYNLTVPPSGRTLSGGLDPAALHMPKRFFGAARKMREHGSLTILATALVETGSKMDDVVYEEFKGTGNMELVLDRKLQEKRIFPAIDILKSGTRREDLLLNKEELEAVYIIRKALNGLKAEEAVDNLLNLFAQTKNNAELVQLINKRKFI
jgi:transcription termination factor Rho